MLSLVRQIPGTAWSIPRLRVAIGVLALLCWNFDSESSRLAYSADAPQAAEAAPKTPGRATEKQLKAYSGLAALAGIVIAGLSLAALIILWGGRLRRQLRRPLPDTDSGRRDFWFLKPPKPGATDPDMPSHVPPHEPPPSED